MALSLIKGNTNGSFEIHERKGNGTDTMNRDRNWRQTKEHTGVLERDGRNKRSLIYLFLARHTISTSRHLQDLPLQSPAAVTSLLPPPPVTVTTQGAACQGSCQHSAAFANVFDLAEINSDTTSGPKGGGEERGEIIVGRADLTCQGGSVLNPTPAPKFSSSTARE